MKKIIYLSILPLFIVSILVFANRAIKNKNLKKPITKPLSAAERKAAKLMWEATPDGLMYKKWEASPAGIKVKESAAKIMKAIKVNTNMEGIVTSLTLPSGSGLGYGFMVKINGADFILSFGPENSDEFKHLYNLKVGDNIFLKSHNISQAPKYSYPIVAGNYVEQNGKIIYKRFPRKGGC